MLPEETLSTTAVISTFAYPVKSPRPVDLLQDWELAGIALNDSSAGLAVKVWHCTLEVDKETGIGYVYVEAPEVTKTLMFSGAGITEVALAFDQNMNPFVAYMQSGTPKIWWYDPIASGMTHTTLPAGCYDLRCCLDEKRAFNIANSDILLSYIRAGNLCIRYQRERYLTEHVLKAGAGSNANLVSMALNRGFRIQWRVRNYELTDDPQALYQVDPFLGDIVHDLNREAGINPENIDTSELYDQTVPGLRIMSARGIDEPIEALRAIYQFDKAQYDRTLHWPKRGREVSMRIPYSDLVPKSPSTLEITYADESELPRIVTVNHIDPTAGFAKNKQTAGRRSNLINARGEEKIDADVVLTPDQAATAGLVMLKQKWNELLDYKFTTTLKYTELTVGDVVEVEDSKGTWHRMRLEERAEDTGNIDWEAKADAGTRTYGSTLIGNALPTPVSTTPGIIPETLLEILNIPPQRDQDDELGVYIAATGDGSAWTGYTLLYSVDGGVSYIEAYTTENDSTIGETLTDLLAEAGYEYQGDQTVEVLVNYALASINPDQLLARQNRIVIGDEVLQYTTATLIGMVGVKFHYRLSGLVRGRFATATPTWPSGTRFVFMDASVVFAQVQRALLGQDLWYKPVSIGHTVDDTTPTAYLFDEGVSQTEWPVSNVASVRDGSNNVTVTFVGSARLGTDSAPFHSKYFRGYRVKFSDGHIINTDLQTATYNSAPIGATVQVCALNDITGEGPYSTALAT